MAWHKTQLESEAIFILAIPFYLNSSIEQVKKIVYLQNSYRGDIELSITG